jgi:squalene synthase HpnC
VDGPERGGADDERGYAQLRAVAAGADAQRSSENFPVALRLLPRTPRGQLRAVYAYARFVDDVGDEVHGDRLALLDLVERAVRRLPEPYGELPPVDGLRRLVTECDLPLQPLLDLIEANRLDQRVAAYRRFDDLLAYCRLSAEPVGRIVLQLAGAATAENVADSDRVCCALQVLEHCQDVAEDAAAGRVYVPADDLATAGVTAERLRDTTTAPALRHVLALQVDRALALLAPGRDLVGRLSGWSRFAVAGYVAGGLATVDALRRADYDVLGRHVRPSRAATARHAVHLLRSAERS